MSDCIFCKIVKAEVPCIKIYEDADFLAFMDIFPVAKGHALLIPKNHIEWMQDCNNDTISKTFIICKNLMQNIKKNIDCDYIQIGVVGEQVPHFHVHLIPQKNGHLLPRWPIISYDTDNEINEYANKIKGE
ncbi:HIT domain-containing protein [Candidatus Nomurabacteria bacterium]|nr:HIT domain-containing protein [Candidatus Nomurabacteria bacterium]